MQPCTSRELAAITGGRLVGDPLTVVGPDVVIDSREVTPGCLFVAIVGERHDGHEFVARAVADGAATVLTSRDVDVDAPTIVVDDTVEGLSALARGIVGYARTHTGLCSVALTGSSGKTSTKDLLAQIFAAVGQTVAPPGSLNNEIGVPVTCCRVSDSTRFLVSEMGARGLGHIAWLTSIVPPDIALVLNVGVAHLGEFSSVETTARAKGELIEALGPDGWAVLNADDPRVATMEARTRGSVACFTTRSIDDVEGDLVVSAEDATLDALARPSFVLRVRSGGERFQAPVTLQLSGLHQVANAAAAAAAAAAAGVDAGVIAAALNEATARSSWRMAVTKRLDGVIVINDAYNANPDSMAAAIAALHHIASVQRSAHPGARSVAVLGDMLELGDGAAPLHHDVGALLRVDELVAVGDHAADLVKGAASVGVPGRVATAGEVATTLDLAPGDVVLLKASRGIGLEVLAAELTEGAGS